MTYTMETYLIVAAPQPEVLAAIETAIGDSDTAYRRALRSSGLPVTTVRARAHFQTTPYQTTIVGVSADEAERINRFRRRHDSDLVTIVGGRAVRLIGVER